MRAARRRNHRRWACHFFSRRPRDRRRYWQHNRHRLRAGNELDHAVAQRASGIEPPLNLTIVESRMSLLLPGVSAPAHSFQPKVAYGSTTGLSNVYELILREEGGG